LLAASPPRLAAQKAGASVCIGDTLRLAGRPIALPVVGTRSQPRYPRSKPGLAWVTRATLERIEPDRRRWSRTAAIRLTDPAAIVFALSMQASLDARPAGEPSDVTDELPVLVYTLDGVLLAITATTLVAVALLSVRERIRDYGVLKTIGLTPRQIASSVVGAHAAVALLAALVAIPAGIGLCRIVYAIAGGVSADLVLAPWWWLALVPIGAPLLVAAVTGLPARLASRIPAADAVRYE
jgi:putative ABC transport system permease protein